MTENTHSSSNRISLPIRLLIILSELYAGGLVIFLMLHIVFPEKIWLVAMVANLMVWLLLPTLLIFPFLFWQRRRVGIALSGMGVLAFVIMYGGLFIPRIRPMPDDTDLLHVMTFNTWSHSTPGSHLEKTFMTADIIGLQEVSRDTAAYLQNELSDEFPYQIIDPENGMGLALLSRYPIIESAYISATRQESRVLQAIIDVNGQEVNVLVAHPPLPMVSYRAYHVRSDTYISNLLTLIDPEIPQIVMGDFNTTDQSINYHLIARSGLIDSHREAGFGLGHSWPVDANPEDPFLFERMVRIDYVWHTPALQAVKTQLYGPVGSDHLPLFVTLRWSGTDGSN